MAIGTPTTLATSSGSTANPKTFTTSASLTAGNLAVLVFMCNGTTNTISSVSDGTNSYSKFFRSTNSNGNGIVLEVWVCPNCSAVSSGATVTINFSAYGSSSYSAIMFQASGLAVASVTDKFATNTAAGSASGNISASTGTLSQSAELVICAFGLGGGAAAPTVTPSAGFTNLTATNDGVNNTNLEVSYDIVSSNSSVTGDPSWSVSGSPNAASVAVFSFNSVSYVSGTLTASGSASVSMAGVTIAATTLSAAGSASVSEAGGGIPAASMAAAGLATASFAGSGVLTGVLSASGSASTSLVGAKVLAGVLSVSGQATASFAAELKQIISTNMIQKPIDYYIVDSTAQPGDASNLNRDLMRLIFRE